MRLQYISLYLFPLFLWGCDAGGQKIQALDSQNKLITCALNGIPLKIDISKNSLDANLFLGDKEIKVNLLEVKDFYQILMRFDSTIGQLKINKAGTELIQLRDSQERVESCTTELKAS